MLVAVKDALFSLPEVALVPDQSPEAAHESTLVDDQFRVEEPSYSTDNGFAVSETVGDGGAATLTVTDWLALPPAPVQVKKNVLVVVNEPRVSLPEVALLPDQAPEAVHEVASLEVQLNVAEPL